ncbi:CpaD family pilus assembly protein [Aurantiacibacter aquimixticola]|uniref:Pilus assembly protein CpaD n=1 Tax=Aurantiacibacter aquimixticola TaxID=1958945 RepID=A0A419RWS1_9SPHN|nr:CpaD family pilus assembly protein [Aurantiacibacter aquimixticola]RJY10239.1 pilus assembly protein CpaD [Aurantiacibacter aquimixticola]
MTYRTKRIAGMVLATTLGFGLSACGSMNTGEQNMSLNSVAQPVVERQNFALDLATAGNGLAASEQARLADWFETMDLRYGDRIALDDPVGSPGVRRDVAAVASRYGLLLSETAPVTEGYIDPGSARVVVTRSIAYVPDCPVWRDQYGFQVGNQTSAGFGCAVNSNIAAMVADPEHLLNGASNNGDTVVMTSNRAIGSYRDAQPTGRGGTTLPEVSSEGD